MYLIPYFVDPATTSGCAGACADIQGSVPLRRCKSPFDTITLCAGLEAEGNRYLATAAPPSSGPSLAQLLAPDLPPGLPPAKPLQVKSVSMRGGATSLQQCPSDGLPELAIVGRSNVGKSSLINMLVGSAKMAQVSKTPGEVHQVQCANCIVGRQLGINIQQDVSCNTTWGAAAAARAVWH